MNLPHAIEAFFKADTDIDGAVPTGAFAADATVTDEGKTHVGHAAIAAWWRAAKQKYRHTAEPMAMRDSTGLIEVQAMVTGQFAGSPAPLTFVFRLDGPTIASLKIGA